MLATWDDTLCRSIARNVHRRLIPGTVELDDLIQEARIAALGYDGDYPGRHIHDALIDHLRHEFGRTFRPPTLPLDPSRESEADEAGTLDQLRGLLAGATEKEREAILLRGQGLTNSEIGRRLGINPSTVAVRFRRALDRETPPDRRRAMTDREIEVLQLAADGLSNEAIADRLVLSVETVKAHMQHSYRALGIAPAPRTVPRARAIAEGFRRGLLT